MMEEFYGNNQIHRETWPLDIGESSLLMYVYVNYEMQNNPCNKYLLTQDNCIILGNIIVLSSMREF